MRIKRIFGTMLLFSLAAACSPISQQAQQDLAKPVNCATTAGDIRLLQSEKAPVTSEILAGVTAIQPAGAVLSLASGTEKPNSKSRAANTIK